MPRAGDAGKCGRDCAYYIATRLGVDTTLSDLEARLGSGRECSMLQLQEVFEENGLHCEAYSLACGQLDWVVPSMTRTGLYILAAFRSADASNDPQHFVVIMDSEASFLQVYDPQVNRIRSLDVRKRQMSTIPVLVVGTEPISLSFPATRLCALLQGVLRSTWFVVLLLATAILFLPFRYIVSLRDCLAKCIVNGWNIVMHAVLRRRKLVVAVSLFCGVCALGFLLLRNTGLLQDESREPLAIIPDILDLGELEISTSREFRMAVKNRTAKPIEIEGVTTSCGCLKAVSWPKCLLPRSERVLRFLITAQRVEKNDYSILIKPKNRNVSPVAARVQYLGVRATRIIPLQRIVRAFPVGKRATRRVAYRLVGAEGAPFILDEVSMAHRKSHLAVRCEDLGEISDSGCITVVLEYDGKSACGNWEDAILFKGRDMNSGKPLVFLTSITGYVASNEFRRRARVQ